MCATVAKNGQWELFVFVPIDYAIYKPLCGTITINSTNIMYTRYEILYIF